MRDFRNRKMFDSFLYREVTSLHVKLFYDLMVYFKISYW